MDGIGGPPQSGLGGLPLMADRSDIESPLQRRSSRTTALGSRDQPANRL
jgi:hypothetical protein